MVGREDSGNGKKAIGSSTTRFSRTRGWITKHWLKFPKFLYNIISNAKRQVAYTSRKVVMKGVSYVSLVIFRALIECVVVSFCGHDIRFQFDVPSGDFYLCYGIPFLVVLKQYVTDLTNPISSNLRWLYPWRCGTKYYKIREHEQSIWNVTYILVFALLWVRKSVQRVCIPMLWIFDYCCNLLGGPESVNHFVPWTPNSLKVGTIF